MMQYGVLPVLLAAFIASCGGGRVVDERGVYVGRVEGTDVAVALVRDGVDLLAYTCGGTQTFETHTRWFPTRGASPVAGSPLAFAVERANWTLTGSVGGDDARGTLVEPSGARFAFTASRIRSDTAAGLYAAVDDGCRTGVIVMQPSSSATAVAQGAWCNARGDHALVTPVRPPVAADDELLVRVDAPGGTRDLLVVSVASPSAP